MAADVAVRDRATARPIEDGLGVLAMAFEDLEGIRERSA